MTTEYITFEEFREKYRQAQAYLSEAKNFENHADKPWIVESTLGRWLYEGSIQVIKDFEKDIKRVENPPESFDELTIVMRQVLNNKLNSFAKKLAITFPENELVMETISK